MARRGVKSAAVREMLTQNPETPVKEIVATLGAKNIKVKPNLVYFLKAKMRAGKTRMARQKVAQTATNANASPIELIRRVKGLAADVGGFKKLKELVEMLAN